MDLTPKQQTSEAIRQAETILIMTGQRPSVDQVTAVIGLAAILRKVGKRVSAVISDSLPNSVQILDTAVVDRNLGGLRDFILKLDTGKAQVDSLRYEQADSKLNIYISPAKGGFAPSDVTFDYGQPNFAYDLAIVLGVPTRARIDRAYEQNLPLFENIPMVNLDFHRSNEGYGAVNLIEPNASSLCEMLVALSESLQGGLLDADIATTLLMGIVASTDRFTASHTTSKSLTVAAQMMAAGGRQQAVVKALYRGGQGGQGGEQRGGQESRGEQRERSGQGGEQRGGQESRSEQRERSGQRDGDRNRGQREARAESTPAPERPERTARPDRVAEVEAPIIAPGHIEMSDAPEQDAEQATQPEPQVNPDAQRTEAPDITAPAEHARPAMADFAAAAEVLSRRLDREHAEGELDGSADAELS